MKRLWISLAILLAIFAGSLGNIYYVAHISSLLVTPLTPAAAWAEAEDWGQAQSLTRQTQAQWDHYAPYLYMTQCHGTTDEINTGFREVLECIQWESVPEYSAANGVLIAEVEHLAEMEDLTLENLL